MDVSKFMDRRLRALGTPNHATSAKRDAKLVLADQHGMHELFWISSAHGSELVRLEYGTKSSALSTQADLNENFLTLEATVGHLLARDHRGHIAVANPYSQDEIIAEVSRNRECMYFADFASSMADASKASRTAIAALPRFDTIAKSDVWTALYRGDVRAVAALDHIATTILARLDARGGLRRHEQTGIQIAIERRDGLPPKIFAGESLDLYIAFQTAHILSGNHSEAICRIRQHQEICWFLAGREETVADFCSAMTASNPDRPASWDYALPHELARASSESDGEHIINLDELLAEERERRADGRL